MKSLIVFLGLCFGIVSTASTDCSLGLNNLNEAVKYNYVIVPGIFNEVLSFYMTEHRRYLMSIGVPSGQIFKLNNGSYIKPEENISYFKEMMKKITGDRKIVFIAHSKGALETLYYLLDTVDLERVKKAILIQGSLDGASSYKMVMGDRPLTGFLSYVRRLSHFKFIREFGGAFDFKYVRNRLKDLSLRKKLLSKITFIESEKDLKDLPARFSVLGGFYQDSFESAGDGVLLKADHVPYELQDNKSVCRKFYAVDHGDLVKAAPWESLRVDRIQNFMKDILLGFERNQ